MKVIANGTEPQDAFLNGDNTRLSLALTTDKPECRSTSQNVGQDMALSQRAKSGAVTRRYVRLVYAAPTVVRFYLRFASFEDHRYVLNV